MPVSQVSIFLCTVSFTACPLPLLLSRFPRHFTVCAALLLQSAPTETRGTYAARGTMQERDRVVLIPSEGHRTVKNIFICSTSA